MPEGRERRNDAARGPRQVLASLLALILAAAGGIPLPAPAQTNGEWVATVRGEARAPLPPRSTLTVSAQETDDVNMRLQGVIEQALREKGYGVGDSGGSGLQLWFDTELSSATVASEPGPENATEVGALPVDDEMLGRGTGAIGFDDRTDVNVAPQVVLPFGAAPPALSGRPYSLTFIVGRPGETPMWQGVVTTRIGSADPFEVAQAMVPLLIEQIGKTTRAESSFP